MTFNLNKYSEILKFITENSQKKVKIVAVSKNQPQNFIEEAINLNIHVFGENRVQEAKDKFFSIKANNPNIELHLTGPLQSNKVKDAINLFDVFQTLDREKLVLEFLKYPDIVFKKKFFVQVNIGNEKNKSGISAQEATSFIEFCKHEAKLPICGLMCIPPIDESPKKHFSLLSSIAKKIILMD